MTQRRSRWTLVWAVAATVLLVCSVGWPDATQTAVRTLSTLATTAPVLAQTPESPAQLEWLGWQFYRLTSPRGKIILFNPALNDPRAAFRNRESPLNLDDITAAHLILAADGHPDADFPEHAFEDEDIPFELALRHYLSAMPMTPNVEFH